MATRKFTTDELMRGLVFLLKEADRLRRDPKDARGLALNLAYAGACIEYDLDYALQNYCDDESRTADIDLAEKELAERLEGALEKDGRPRPACWSVHKLASKIQRLLVWTLTDTFGNRAAVVMQSETPTEPARITAVEVFNHQPGRPAVVEVFSAAFLQKYGGTMTLRDAAEAVMLLQEYDTEVTLPADEDLPPWPT